MGGIKAVVLALLWAVAGSRDLDAQTPPEVDASVAPSVLIVTAHPDDDALFGGLVYRLAMELGARVELAVVTDGAGGYRYSTLAEPLYGLKLTDPVVARKHLPGIRKRELLAGGKFVGIRDYHFLDQPDTGFTTDPDSILSQVWDGVFVQERLQRIMAEGDFAFVLTHLPMEGTHGHHKSASILAVRAASALGDDRPVVLAAWFANKADTVERMFEGLPGYPEAGTTSTDARWRFDRTHGLGLDGRLNYKIPINWLISEHKSQGTMQQLVNLGDLELYWLYKTNPPDAAERADALFDLVNTWPDP